MLFATATVVRRESAPVVAIAVVIATGGVLAESALSAAGEFDYVAPDEFGVPWWLFPLYLHGALLAPDVVSFVRPTVPTGTPAAADRGSPRA